MIPDKSNEPAIRVAFEQALIVMPRDSKTGWIVTPEYAKSHKSDYDGRASQSARTRSAPEEIDRRT